MELGPTGRRHLERALDSEQFDQLAADIAGHVVDHIGTGLHEPVVKKLVLEALHGAGRKHATAYVDRSTLT